MMGWIGCPETSTTNYQPTPRNVPEEWKPQFNVILPKRLISGLHAVVYSLQNFSFVPRVLHAPPIYLSLTWSSKYFVYVILFICHFVTLWPEYSPRHLWSSRNERDQVSRAYKTTDKITVLYILVFTVVDSRECYKTLRDVLTSDAVRRHYANKWKITSFLCSINYYAINK